jgi:hypothetical protein
VATKRIDLTPVREIVSHISRAADIGVSDEYQKARHARACRPPTSHHAAVVNESDTVPGGAAHCVGGHDAIRSGGVISARDPNGDPTVAPVMGGRLTTLR